MSWETLRLTAELWDEWYERIERAFGGPADPAEERALMRDLTEFKRSLAVRDAGEVVGTAAAYSFRMTVPGGDPVPTAGIANVTVQATHRRRGMLTAMMRRQLDDARAGGEPLAALTATEPAIYGRFGFGAATLQMAVAVETRRVVPAAPEGTDAVRLRVVRPADAAADCEEVYRRLVPGRPGMLQRRPHWERLPLLDPAAGRDGAGGLLCVLAERDGAVTGYARYAVAAGWSAGGPDNTVVLRDLSALDPATAAALWRYLFGVDLVSKLTARNLPADDPLLHLVDDQRRCLPRRREGMFVRLVDVGRALAARTYTVPVDLVLEVSDAFCPWNAGRWRLTGDGTGATCVPTRDPADLALSARELGAAYLGGASLAALAAAGRVAEVRPGALTEASVAFRGVLEPWLPHGF